MPRVKAGGTLSSAELLEALLQQLGGKLKVGTKLKGELVAGDLVADVHIQVRRWVKPADDASYRALALDRLQQQLYRIWHCECRVNVGRQGWTGRGEHDCRNPIRAAVVWQGTFSSVSTTPAVQYVCLRHQEQHGLDPAQVLAVVALSKQDLDPIYRRAQAERDRLDAQSRAEDEARVRRKES